ncbi:hypothetical protein PVAND_007063 [Polypedilum vanderplanki]|uniref:Ecdysis triggering hormone n=1 Tax=Polypedilum vanderplanki TaxID=319348 RepID=A0A9J6C6Q5_POLVA|nr:hypothetical protein PVAND_007063 [Polypedilum vanderplanki]
MKVLWFFVTIVIINYIVADDAPGFFLKTTKNVPRLGKRVFIKQGSKNIPRLGRRSYQPNVVEELKYYNHVQPFDSKFILDFLSDELLIGEGDLKFLSWSDLDRALENDASLKEKLSTIARDKEVEELRKFAYQMSKDDDNEINMRPYGSDRTQNKIFQKFIPYDSSSKDLKYNNKENDVYYYYSNEIKRSNKNNKIDDFKKLFSK